jgi:hypothetical protein
LFDGRSPVDRNRTDLVGSDWRRGNGRRAGQRLITFDAARPSPQRTAFRVLITDEIGVVTAGCFARVFR